MDYEITDLVVVHRKSFIVAVRSVSGGTSHRRGLGHRVLLVRVRGTEKTVSDSSVSHSESGGGGQPMVVEYSIGSRLLPPFNLKGRTTSLPFQCNLFPATLLFLTPPCGWKSFVLYDVVIHFSTIPQGSVYLIRESHGSEDKQFRKRKKDLHCVPERHNGSSCHITSPR